MNYIVNCPPECSDKHYKGEKIIETDKNGKPIKWILDEATFNTKEPSYKTIDILIRAMMRKSENKIVLVNKSILSAIKNKKRLNLIFLDFDVLRDVLTPYVATSGKWFKGDGFYKIENEGLHKIMGTHDSEIKDGDLTYTCE